VPGLEGARQAFSLALAAFSDFRHEIHDQLAEGDKVVTRVTGLGTHTGELLGIPATGKEVQMTGVAIHRIAEGKLAEHWALIDALGLLQQLGAIPAPASAAGPPQRPTPRSDRARPARGRAGTPAENKAIVRQFVERAQSSGQEAALAAIDEMMSPDFSESSGIDYGVPPTRDGMKQLFTMLHTAFPDLRTSIHDQVAEGDKVVTRKTFHATHRGELMGTPCWQGSGH
jgi:predicted ester cyclase